MGTHGKEELQGFFLFRVVIIGFNHLILQNQELGEVVDLLLSLFIKA